MSPLTFSRRQFLHVSAATTASLWTAGVFADQLTQTPRLTEGPFYPDQLPLDTDNDLLVINESITPAVGEITHLSGNVLDASGEPIRNAFVEIWQVDNNGNYLHSQGASNDNRDTNFQGYGRFLTDSTGRYYFRTIKPVPYPGRTPHIHVAVSRNGHRVLTTQLLIKGHPQNAQDGVFRNAADQSGLETLLVDFKPMRDSKIGELSAKFDMVVGVTPDEAQLQEIQGVAPSDRSRSGGRDQLGPRPGGPQREGRGARRDRS